MHVDFHNLSIPNAVIMALTVTFTIFLAYNSILKKVSEGYKSLAELRASEIADLSARMDKLTRDYTDIKNEHSECLKQNIRLQAKLETSETQIAKLETRVEWLQLEFAKIGSKLS